MAAAIEIEDIGETTIKTERIPDAQRNASWTYMEFRITGDGTTDGIKQSAVNNDEKTSVRTYGNTISVSSERKITDMTVCSADGRIITKMRNPGFNFQTQVGHKGFAIVRMILSDGKVISRKIVL